MKVKEIQLKNKTVWLAIDQLRAYSADFRFFEEKPEFLCFFNLTEPTSIVYGELLRDKEGKPILFRSVDEAIEKAKELLNQRL